MKTLFQAVGMALILFFYGYFLSIAGHDHSAHEGKDKSTEHSVLDEHQMEDGHEHNHDHAH